jgi:serine/threonine-protein kinase RsbT
LDHKSRATGIEGRRVAKLVKRTGLEDSKEPSRKGRSASADYSLPIETRADILKARKQGRELAARLGFSSTDCTLIAAAISELTRNIILYAGRGEIRLATVARKGTSGISISARDDGPGIIDIERAIQDGLSASRGLGLGLPGVKRIMDEFEIISSPKMGTRVMVKKWKPK